MVVRDVIAVCGSLPSSFRWPGLFFGCFRAIAGNDVGGRRHPTANMQRTTKATRSQAISSQSWLEYQSGSAMCRKESVRFDSFRFQIFRKLIGSIRFGSVRFCSARNKVSRFDAVRPAFLFGRVVARSASVRFGSASGSGRFQNETVRFGSAGSVRFLFLPVGVLRICQTSRAD